MNSGRRLVLLLLVLGMVATYFIYYSFMANEVDVVKAIAEDAVINLNDLDETQQSIELRGQWAYYEGYLLDEIKGQVPVYVEIPENRKKEISDNYYRYATYTVTINGLKPNHMYGIFSGGQVTAYNLYVNDIKILSNGQVSKNADTHISEWKHTSSSFYADDEGQARIAVEISNYEYQDGLFWSCPVIGDPQNVFDSHVIMILVNVILIVVFLCIAIILLIIFIKFKLELSTLYFVILLINMVIRMMVTSNKPILLLINNIPWSILIRIDYLTGYLYLPIFAIFFLELAKFKYMKVVRRAASVYSVFMITFVFLSDVNVYSSIYIPYLWILASLLVFIGYQLVLYNKGDLFHTAVMTMVIASAMIALIAQMFINKASYLPVAMLNAIIALTVIESMKTVSNLRKKDMMAFRAMIDPLTGLYNRHYLHELSNHSNLMNDSDDYYMLFMDLDNFKNVNDIYGHDIGDHVLQIVAQRLRGCMRESDSLIRYGGDEFVIVAKVSQFQEVEALAERILGKMSSAILHEGNKHEIGISIGISKCQSINPADIQSAIKSSDEAMYIVKNNGGCNYEFMSMIGTEKSTK